ncbi:MAG: cbb3-type cytochrome c oxidase subunit I [Candidatus Methylacidiphilales bacterium]|nr:cbb3-type cytochrome c oxidase subunit I [Candidatus Methylacidiphilales bacterium]
MSAIGTETTLGQEYSTAVPHYRIEDAAERSELDASTRFPVLLYLGSGLFWLLVGTVFALIASFKLHNPQLFDGGTLSWLAWPRVRTAHLNAVIYGWASTAGIGVGIWLIARLCRTPLRYPAIVIVAGIFWNIGVAIGITAILAGQSTGVEWLEFPPYVAAILFFSYILISIWTVLMFYYREPGHIYVSQWYLLAAFIWFPWLYATTYLLIFAYPVQGVLQAITNWWYGHNVLGLWFTPIGLASAYYFIPKVIGRPVYSYYLSALGFWTLAFFYAWNGGHHLIGGPIPLWIQTVSIVASVMMIIPVSVVAINHHLTMTGNFHYLITSPTLRFTVFGAMSYTLVSLQGMSMAIPSLNYITHFTHYTIGHSHLGLYSFYTSIIFGAMYYIVPRLTECEWPSANLIKLHFWCVFYGSALMFVCLSIGGITQGTMWLTKSGELPAFQFIDTVQSTIPYLIGRSVAGTILAIGHVVFAYHFGLMILRMGQRTGQPTLFIEPAKA